MYSGPLSSRVKLIKFFSLSSSCAGLCLQPILVEKWSTQTPNIPVAVAIFTLIGFHTYVTPILLHLITKKYVISLYYSEKDDVYIAKTYTLFLRDKLVSTNIACAKVYQIYFNRRLIFFYIVN